MNILERISTQIAPAERVFYDWQLELATRICRIMESKNIGSSQMAQLLGISEEELDDLVHSNADPKLSTIARIAALTKTEVVSWINSDLHV